MQTAWPSDSAPFADIAEILRDTLPAYLPIDQVSVADFAVENRWLDNRGGGYVGRWSHDEAPYLVEPMETLDSRDHLAVAIPGPGRCGKTAIAENWLLRNVCTDPADMLWYEPTDPMLKSYVKRVIEPMVELHPGLRGKLGSLSRDDSLYFKRFREMWVEFLPAIYSNLINKSAGRIVIDELDACPPGEGDIYALADYRRQTFGAESMILAISHPDLAEGMNPTRWARGIMRLYGRSDRRTWWWPCPQCNGFSSPNPTAERVMVLHYPEDGPLDEIRDGARLLCPLCGCLIEDQHRRAMNIDGRWAGLGQTVEEDGTITGERLHRDIAGFWVVGVMSPFIIGGIGSLASELVAAERDDELTGQTTARDVMTKRLGIPPKPARQVGSISAETLAERADPALELGRVPDGVRFLTAWADAQANRFEILVRGWGAGGESWVIDLRRMPADPASSAEDWDKLLGVLSETAYPLADGSGRAMRLRAAGFDSAGAAGVTQQAYDAWRRFHARRKARLLGVFDGREGWNLVPTKGIGSANAVRLQVRRPDSARKDRAARAAGAVPLAQFGANSFKDDLAGQLARAEPGPGHVHFPAGLLAERAPHPFFEGLVSEGRRANGSWDKISAAVRNEPLDLMVGTHVVAHLHGLARINWDRPPPWAAEWGRNSGVGVALAAPEAAGPVLPGAAPARLSEPSAALRRALSQLG